MGQTRKKNKKQPALLSPPIPEKCSSSKQHADWWSSTVIVLNGGYGSLVRSYSYMQGLCNYSIMYLKSVVMERKRTLEDFNSEE